MRALEPRGRRAVSALTAAAALVVAGISVGAIVTYPSLTGGNGGSKSTSTRTFNGTSYTTTTYSPPVNWTSTTVSTNSSGSWQAWQVANVTLGSPVVQNYVHDAYNYSFNIRQTGDNPVLVSTSVFVIGHQYVAGNWSTGYNVTYSGIASLNVTVQFTPPKNYTIIHYSVNNYTDDHGFVNFTLPEKNAIAAAVVNSTVKTYLSQYPSFVGASFLFPSGNSTYGGDYLVLFYQLNGAKILGVFVNPTRGAVVATYNDSRVWRLCYPNGLCYSSPWGS